MTLLLVRPEKTYKFEYAFDRETLARAEYYGRVRSASGLCAFNFIFGRTWNVSITIFYTSSCWYWIYSFQKHFKNIKLVLTLLAIEDFNGYFKQFRFNYSKTQNYSNGHFKNPVTGSVRRNPVNEKSNTVHKPFLSQNGTRFKWIESKKKDSRFPSKKN